MAGRGSSVRAPLLSCLEVAVVLVRYSGALTVAVVRLYRVDMVR